MPKVVASAWGNYLIPVCGFVSGATSPPLQQRCAQGGENPSDWEQEEENVPLSPSSCFPFQLFCTEQGDASSCSPCPAERGWEGKTGMKKGWDRSLWSTKTIKILNFSNRHCFGHKNWWGGMKFFGGAVAVRTGRVCSQLSTRLGAERKRNPKEGGNILILLQHLRFPPPSPAPRSSFCYF